MAAVPTFMVLGKPIPRVEGPLKVSGRAIYTADITPPNTLWAKNVRSPLPHARIVSIHAARALAVPGVRAVLTAADFPNQRIGRRLKDNPILCDERVRFIGDRVAVVAADDRDAAEEGALLVDVEYEELPAVFDPLEAMQPGAPIIHPDARSYRGFPLEVPADIPNVCAYQRWDRGDVAAGFAEADLVVEHTFRTPLMHQGYLEPTAYVLAISPGGTGRLEVWASNKTPYNLRDELASILGLPVEDFLVHNVRVGADFGSKGSAADLVTGFHVARMRGRPVKFVSSSHEDLVAGSPRHPSIVTLRTGLKRDGTMVAREARVVFNTGAYGAFKPSPNGMLGGAGRAGGSYAIPHVHIEGFCVYTNQVPCAYMRAPGSPQVIFAVEAHTDLLAREVGMDPLELRLRNVRRRSSSGEPSGAPQVLQAAADAIGWAAEFRVSSSEFRGESWTRNAKPETRNLVGRGMAIYDRGTGTGEGTSDITVNPDGTVTALTAMPDNGTGGLTVVAQVVAEAMGVPFHQVGLVWGDTDALPVDVGSGASRMTNVAGQAAIAACEQVKEQLAPLAAAMLGVEKVEWVPPQGSPAGLQGLGEQARGGWIPAPSERERTEEAGEGFVSLEELATEMIKPGDPLAHAQVTLNVPRSEDVAYCVQAAEVEVDRETGHVRLRKMVSAQDVGTIVNELGHQGQIEGGMVQGVGLGLMEDLAPQDGRIGAGNLGEYKVPTARDIPELITVNIPTTASGPFGAKAIGELPHVPTAAAIANAVADAIGAPLFQLPITAERVLAAIEGKRGSP